jgi:hypothetical protein
VRICEYQPTMMHAKTMTIDGAWSSVGSVNFDNRSFQLHDEATLCVQSECFAGQLTEQFERDLEVSEEMRRGRFARRSELQRGQERVMQLAPPRALGPEAHPVLLAVGADPEHADEVELHRPVVALDVVPALGPEGAEQLVELLLGDAQRDGHAGLEADRDVAGRRSHGDPQ